MRAGTLQRYVHRKCLARLWRAFSGMCIVGAAGENAHFAAAFARIECHYFINKVRLCVQRKKSPVVALRLCMPRCSDVSRGAETSIGEVRCGQGFFSTDEWILENAHRIKHIPTIIVQGR